MNEWENKSIKAKTYVEWPDFQSSWPINSWIKCKVAAPHHPYPRNVTTQKSIEKVGQPKGQPSSSQTVGVSCFLMPHQSREESETLPRLLVDHGPFWAGSPLKQPRGVRLHPFLKLSEKTPPLLGSLFQACQALIWEPSQNLSKVKSPESSYHRQKYGQFTTPTLPAYTLGVYINMFYFQGNSQK